MASMGPETLTVGGEVPRKPRFLCLHGFRTSGEIMKKQVVGNWPSHVISRLDLFFADAPFPFGGESKVEAIFPPPYFEWFQFSEGFMEFYNFDECLAYIEDLMIKHGPFDGLMGFSQGAALSAALPGLQLRGVALTKVPKIKFAMIISGGQLKKPEITDNAYCTKIECPSLHFIGHFIYFEGEEDFLKEPGEKLLECFVDPLVIRHPEGHTVPRLDEKSLETMDAFLTKIESHLARTC